MVSEQDLRKDKPSNYPTKKLTTQQEGLGQVFQITILTTYQEVARVTRGFEHSPLQAFYLSYVHLVQQTPSPPLPLSSSNILIGNKIIIWVCMPNVPHRCSGVRQDSNLTPTTYRVRSSILPLNHCPPQTFASSNILLQHTNKE